MAAATCSVAATMIGPTPFGSSSRTMIRGAVDPIARAAVTNSCSLSVRNCARTILATSIQAVKPTMRVMDNTDVFFKVMRVALGDRSVKKEVHDLLVALDGQREELADLVLDLANTYGPVGQEEVERLRAERA